MKILFLGDIHGSLKGFDEVAKIESDIILISGDITSFGGKGQAGEVLKKIRDIGRQFYSVFGNLDTYDVASYLEKRGYSIHRSGVIIDDVGIMGVGGGNISPFSTPIEYSEEEFEDILKAGFEFIKEARIKVLLSHTPPHNTKCDRIITGLHVGSKAIREFILEHNIDYCLCGHIHESAGIDRLGSCIVMNPGPFKDGNFGFIDTQNNTYLIKNIHR